MVTIRTTLALMILCALGAPASAQAEFPTKPVVMVVPFPPGGGGADYVGRVVGAKLSERLGQPVVIENRPGAAGNIGVAAVAKSAPDGYTWLFVPQGNITINATLMKNLPFDWERDFVPVTLVAQAANALVVHPSVPARNVAELIAYAKANPGKLTYASPGVGSSLHLAGELLKREAGIDIVHVPYKGTTQAMQDLMGGQVTMMFGSLPTLLPQVRAGKLRALAVTTAQRSSAAPELPTLIESGLKDFDVPSWYGALVPVGTPPAIVAQIQQEIAAIVTAPDVRAALEGQGLYPVANRPDAFAAQIRRETAAWAKIIREAGIQAE
jgi:tripartite-type tricarboxylate transporter receptor subunit TctC